MNVGQFNGAQERINTATRNQFGDYSYAAGYWQSMAKHMFQNMNKRQQAEFLRQVEADAARLESLNSLTN